MQVIRITLRKAIIRRSNLQSKNFKTRTSELLKKYRKKKNYCSILYNKGLKTLFNSLKYQTFHGKIFNAFFLKTVTLLTLVGDNENIISDDKLVSEELNIFLKMSPTFSR